VEAYMSQNWQEQLQKETAVYVYIDLANVLSWKKTLGWSFRIEDLLRDIFIFSTVRAVRVYYGFDERESGKSIALHKRIRKAGAILRTKPVKYIRKAVEEGLFVRHSTLKLLSPEATTLVESIVETVRNSGVVIEERKCNFDVEIAMDILDDIEKSTAIMLLSGDSDFFAPLERAKVQGKRVFIVGVRGQVAKELFDIADEYVDFGRLYAGVRWRGKSENPA
jgi:uncharacterized LabA/DUF88 family protein